jgi:hypothetical protein
MPIIAKVKVERRKTLKEKPAGRQK